MPEESVWQAERFIPRLLRAHAIAPDDPGAARRLLEPILAARDVREVIFAAEGCLLAAKLAVIEPHLDPVADDAYRDRVRHASTQLLTHGSLERAWLSEITTRLDAAADKVSPQAWQNCVEAWAGIQANFRAAECSLELAQASLKVGNRDQAVVALINAWETAAALGAEPLEGRSRSLAARSRIGLPGAQEGHDRDIGLTAREQEVLAVLVTGATNDEISQALFISPKTVSVHVSHILAKLDATNRTEVAVLAQRRGWV